MRTLLNPWFIFFCAVWAVVYLSRSSNHPVLLLRGHLTDLLAVPVIANLGLCFQRIFADKRSTYILKPGHIIFIVIYISVVFEWLLPMYQPKKFTGDWLDVLFYITGGLFFWRVMNQPIKNKS